MTPEKLNRLWLITTGLIIVIIITGGIYFFLNKGYRHPLSVTPPPDSSVNGQVYIDGAVVRPGAYPFTPDDTLDDLLEASGGVNPDANLAGVALHIASTAVPEDAQKVDINRAPLWLLEALPGIGEVKARAIIDYRVQNGHFNNIDQITSVPGITPALFDQIRAYITTHE